MSNIKTITLGGAEQEARIAGQNCDIRNDGADVIYASAKPNINAGDDGVLSIPAGQAAKLLDCRGTVYLLGTGTVLLCGNDYSELVFKCAAAAGGGGEDTVARNAITALTTEVTDNSTDIALLKDSATGYNLVINPDFAINQRGASEYTNTGYTVDRWKNRSAATKVTVLDKGIRCECNDGTPSSQNILSQLSEYDLSNFSGSLTLSVNISDCAIAGDGYFAVVARIGNESNSFLGNAFVRAANGVTGVFSNTVHIPEGAKKLSVLVDVYGASAGDHIDLEWIKLENSALVTPFIPPEPATELEKCQRYYQVRTSGDIDPVDLRPTMAEIIDIVEREDGNYGYIAEL